MEESLLDVVFIEDEVIDRNFFGYVKGSRRKVTDMWGRDRQVLCQDEFHNTVYTAKEINSLLGGSAPYVEFYDKDKKPIGRAYVTQEIMSGRRKIEYKDNQGNIIDSQYVDEQKVLDAKIERMKKEEQLQMPSALAFEPATPLVLSCVAFLGIALNALFGFLNTHIDMICHYGSIVTMYGICPLMVVVFLALCRIKKTFLGQRLFWAIHLLVYAAGFAFVAYMADCLYKDRNPEFLFQIAPVGLEGPMMFLLCLAPTFVMGTFSGVWTLLLKRLPGHGERVILSKFSMNTMKIGNLALVAVAMAVMLLSDAYGSGGFSGVIRVSVVWLFMVAILSIVFWVACLPYKLLSKKF